MIEMLNKTYAYIKRVLGDRVIDGYIGFSNGGFFLAELVQRERITQPVIMIGSAGQVHHDLPVHSQGLTLIIGTRDRWHYDPAQRFARALKNNGIARPILHW